MGTEFSKHDNVDRRNHGCDGCRKLTPTERFDGYLGHYLWLCSKCYKELVSRGFVNPINKDSEVNNDGR